MRRCSSPGGRRLRSRTRYFGGDGRSPPVVDLGRETRSSSDCASPAPSRLEVDGASGARPHRRDRRGAPRQGGHVRRRSKDRPPGRAESPGARAAAGAALRKVRTALDDGGFEALDGGRFRVAGLELGPDEVWSSGCRVEGWTIATADGRIVAVDTTSTTSCVWRAACTTWSTTSRCCARRPGSS